MYPMGCVRSLGSHVKFHQPGPSNLSTLDLNANVNIGRRRTGDDISSLPVLGTGELKINLRI
jgi:hypothetical protein